MELAGKSGLVIAAAGTHPFSSWLTQEITPLERYLGVKQDLADLAQQLLIFGTHVHVGIEDRDFLIDAMNVARYFVPHVLTSPPAHRSGWDGTRDSNRTEASSSGISRGRGIPPTLDSWTELRLIWWTR